MSSKVGQDFEYADLGIPSSHFFRISFRIYLHIIFKEKLENVFMKHYAPNHMLAPKEGL